MQSRLLWKLLGINILAIGVVILTVWLAFDYRAADYFAVLMQDYRISPTDAHQMFLLAVHRYMVWASLFALVCACVFSFFLTRKVLRPLSQMTDISRQIATGDYTARVQLASRDEVGQLALSFNRMADSLERIERLRRTMVSDVAHGLRTPLTNIRGYLEALRDGVLPPSEQTFDLLYEEALRLVRLVEDLLQLVRADAAKGALRVQKVQLQELIDHVLDLFQPQFVVKGITIAAHYASGTDVAMADADRLAQAIRNLLQNAWQFTPSGGHVKVTAERRPTEIHLCVANTGSGIAPADLPFIFERFYQGEATRSQGLGGAGIGLAIVKELIDAHGGQVGAENAPGETRVWLTLPV